MKIKDRLALYFTLVSSALLLVVLVSMYLASAYFFRKDFYSRIYDRAKVTAQLYLEADEISSDSLSHVQQRMLERLPGEVIRVYNDRNQASFIKDESQFWDKRTIERVRRERQSTFLQGDRQTVGIYYPDNQGNFVILASAIDSQGHLRLLRIMQVMLVIFILVNSFLFFIGRWFAGQSLIPIDKLAKEMNRISASQLHFRADEGNGKDETSSLAKSFNRLLQHLQNSFELQQTFVANASHELRTPLTSITGEIQLALHKERSTEDYQALLASVLADTGRLTETVTGLMELAQTDMEYTRAQVEEIRVDDLLWEMKAYWSDKPLAIDILQLPDHQDSLTIIANKNLLKIALNNIISNAFKFSNDQTVYLTLKANGQEIVFMVKDQGVGICPDDLPKIFTPFYRGDNGTSFNGNGIGLYMAQMIIRLFNGQIEIASAPNEGTTVSVLFSPLG
jgi:signal transduction histidine kinase